MIINVSYDQSASSLPAGFTSGVSAVVQFFQSQFTDPITFNLHVGYGDVHGSPLNPGSLGQSYFTLNPYTYTQLKTALLAQATSTDDQIAIGTLPATDPTGGGQILIAQAEAAALGLLAPNTTIDTYVGFSNTASFAYNNSGGVPVGQYDFFGVVAHEISEAMGRALAVGQTISGFTNSYYPLDFFHYSAAGTREFVGTNVGYFSIDGGTTNLDNFNSNPNGDFGDWDASAGNDSFLAFSNSGVLNAVTPTDLIVMDILGYDRAEPIISAMAIQNDYFGIVRLTLPLDQATAVANAINAGMQTEANYVNGLLSQVASTTIPAVAVEGSMYAEVGSSTEITALATQFLPPQVANAIKFGFNPQVYASEALGLVFAFGNESGSTAFADAFGPSNVGMPNSAGGDAAFAAAASSSIFGSASTANLVNVLDGFVVNWKAFYTSHGVPGIANATPTQIDLAARGAAWGDAVGVALANEIGPLKGQAINFLMDAAEGIAEYSASLVGQPLHQPFQGEMLV